MPCGSCSSDWFSLLWFPTSSSSYSLRRAFSASCRDRRKVVGPPVPEHGLGCVSFIGLNTLPLCPLVVTKDGIYVLDMAAKIDATADYICKAKWGDVEFPPPFGREAYPEVRKSWGGGEAGTYQLSVCQHRVAALFFGVNNTHCWIQCHDRRVIDHTGQILKTT